MDEDADGSVCVGDHNVGSRKKQITGGKRASAKTKRYRAPRKPLTFEPCKNNNERFSCIKFRPRDLKVFRTHFFEKLDKARQDSIISNTHLGRDQLNIVGLGQLM